MCCPWLCSHSVWLLLKCSAIGIGFNIAETNCGIAHILGILLMAWYNTYFLATSIICRLFTLNVYAQFYASLRRVQTNYGSKKIPQKTGLASYLVSKSHVLFLASPKKKTLAPGVSAFHKLLESFQKVSRNFPKTCWKAAQKPMKSCFL